MMNCMMILQNDLQNMLILINTQVYNIYTTLMDLVIYNKTVLSSGL